MVLLGAFIGWTILSGGGAAKVKETEDGESRD